MLSKFIHIRTVADPLFLALACRYSHIYTARHSKALLKLNLKLILPLLYPYVTEAVDGREEVTSTFLTYEQT